MEGAIITTQASAIEAIGQVLTLPFTFPMYLDGSVGQPRKRWAGYLDSVILLEKTRDKRKMTEGSPHGPGFDSRIAEIADTMEILGSSHLGEIDLCVFVLRDRTGKVIGETRVG